MPLIRNETMQYQELHGRLRAQRELLERARDAADNRHGLPMDLQSAILDLIRFCESAQNAEESVFQLFLQCQALVDICQKAVNSEQLRAPIIIQKPESE